VLVTAIHAVPRIKRPQVNNGGKPLHWAAPAGVRANARLVLRRCGVDGRDEPGYDESGSETLSAIAGPTVSAMSACLRPRGVDRHQL
jgi:hypothetical protein